MAWVAHLLWQRHNLRPEEFYAMPSYLKAFYIASEDIENEHPCRRDCVIKL